MKHHIIAYIAIVISFFFVPWWVFLPLVIGYNIYFSPAYEIIFLGFIADMLYGVPYIHTAIAGVICICVYSIRSYIRV